MLLVTNVNSAAYPLLFVAVAAIDFTLVTLHNNLVNRDTFLRDNLGWVRALVRIMLGILCKSRICFFSHFSRDIRKLGSKSEEQSLKADLMHIS